MLRKFSTLMLRQAIEANDLFRYPYQFMEFINHVSVDHLMLLYHQNPLSICVKEKTE
jgi:hypothetical protein